MCVYMGNFTVTCPKCVSRTLKNERLQNCVLYALTERVSPLIKSPKISRLNLENLLRYLHSSICPIINTYLFVQERTFLTENRLPIFTHKFHSNQSLTFSNNFVIHIGKNIKFHMAYSFLKKNLNKGVF